jgi:hypothetical protein
MPKIRRGIWEVATQFAGCNVALDFARGSPCTPSSHIATVRGLSWQGGRVALRISTLPLVYDRAPLNSHRVPYFGTFAGLSCGFQGVLGIVGEAEDARGVRSARVKPEQNNVCNLFGQMSTLPCHARLYLDSTYRAEPRATEIKENHPLPCRDFPCRA